MTGRPAETWRKFKFATPPDWAYALLILVCLGGIGFIAFAIVMALVAQRATGYLPLTRSSGRTVNLALWIPVGLLIAAPVAWAIALVLNPSTSNPASSAVAVVLLWLGLLFLLAGLAGRLLVTRLICPRAKVMEVAPGQTDRIVELRNVHPLFVTAVLERQHARASQLTPAPQSPYLPGSI
jgi:drug/metabolite transporter (DMT)-like permease